MRARPASPTHPLSAALVAWALRTRLTDGRERVTERVQVAEGRWVALTRDPASGLWLDVAPGRRSGHRPPADAPEGLPLAMAELAWFLTPDLLPDRRADLAWSHVAAVALHLFARRLTGFGLSSAGYLSRNFLEGASPVERGAAGVTVGLPSVPLHLVLRMSGWGTGRERVPWLPGGTLLIAADQA